ncbi:MAG: phospholipase D-like domain-containing protein [Bacteroidales bacterium]|nr:phospholipase D-like domain-containing protein [Bacteroidales bacterium]MDY0143894.1 phospholipase D-like domain-containing protein [Bacteroidales bacterium]
MPDTITLLTNTGESHIDEILRLIEKSEEIIFAVGFLKDSGLNNIQNSIKDFTDNAGAKSRYYIGTGFGETSPKALLELHKIIKKKPGHQLVLCTPKAGIFHPKVYYFRSGNKTTIITGSSNLTESGMRVNDEVSIKLESTIDSEYSKRILNYFDDLTDQYFVENLKELITQYKEDLDNHNSNYYHKPKFRFRPNRKNDLDIDLPRLKEYYKYYIESDKFIEPQYRERKYEQAKSNLDRISSFDKLTKEEFHNLFGPLVGHSGYQKLWHSGSIHRKTHKTLDYIPAFREIVRIAKSNIDKEINVVFDIVIEFLKSKKKKKEISGIGLNIIAEILMTYNPRKFANINDNPIASLELLGKKFKPIQSFKGFDYEEYVELLNSIKIELGMKTFLEVDSFFNYVYWNLIEE